MPDTATPRPIALFDMDAQQRLIRVDLDRRIAAVLDHGRFINGPEVSEIEERLADFAGAGHAVGVSSGTDALQIAMMAEGIGPGDAVFLPAFTYTATAEVPLVLGATPVFVDVEEDSFNIDIADLERRIAAVKAEGRLRPRAVVGVDLFGLPADWDSLRRICTHEGMFALDDAAQAFGARFYGSRLGGSLADATALSFYPTKTLGCYGDGGMILTEDAAKAELYRSLRTHGEGRTRYEVERTGMNGRLDSLQAAVLLAKLPLFDDEIAARHRIAGWYRARLAGHPAIGLQAEPAGAENVYGLFTIRLPDTTTRARVQAALSAAAISSAIYYPKPLHHQPAYRAAHAAGFADGPAPLPVSEALAGRVVSLPMHPYLAEAEVERVASALRAAL
jgi:dTDP-4-amino-4,6-dideoxygalactose transaminase